MTTESHYMARALNLARRGLMTTHPNPRVGCVLVKDDVVVGEGWHERAGGPHAEILALQQAGSDAQGAVAYVTLEPCSHHGRTPPCVDALIEAKVMKVVVAMSDPNPQVSGRGLAALLEEGIGTECDLMSAEAEVLNRGFLKRMLHGRPWVTVKLAMSMDGRTAAADGSSQWITGPQARQDVHRLRAEAGTILTGIGTVLADDPQLNVRLENYDFNTPHRIVLDSQLQMPATAKMLSIDGRTTVLTCSDEAGKAEELQNAGAVVVKLQEEEGRVDLSAALDWLGLEQTNEVLVEAGAELAGAFLQAGLVDELIVYMAPRLLGDRGRGLLSLPGLESITQAHSLDIVDVRAVGQDWRITAHPA